MQRDTSPAKSKVGAPGAELIVVLALSYYFNPPTPTPTPPAYPKQQKNALL